MEGLSKRGTRSVSERSFPVRADAAQLFGGRRREKGDCYGYYDAILLKTKHVTERHAFCRDLQGYGFFCVDATDEMACLRHIDNDKRLNIILCDGDNDAFVHSVLAHHGEQRDFAFLVLGNHESFTPPPAYHIIRFVSEPFCLDDLVRHIHSACYELEVGRRTKERMHLEKAFRRFAQDFFGTIDNKNKRKDGNHGAGGDSIEGSRRRVLALSRRVLRSKFAFGGVVASHSCLLMLLELYESYLFERMLKVTALCYATGVPQTTVLRHIDELVAMGLVLRQHDRKDKRRVFLSLSPKGIRSIEDYLNGLMRDKD